MVQTKKRHVPINLRQSGDFDAKMLLSTRVRKSPYFHLAKEAGCWCYTVYNRIYHPRAYIALEDGGLLAEYEYLTKHVSMWDVAVERQIQIKGPDAVRFVDYVITRSVEKIEELILMCEKLGGSPVNAYLSSIRAYFFFAVFLFSIFSMFSQYHHGDHHQVIQ